MNTGVKTQTVLINDTLSTINSTYDSDIPKNQRNIWVDISTGHVGDLQHFLNDGWKIIDSSTSVSITMSPGGHTLRVTHSQLIVEK